jgi:hypothetical protein
MTDTNDNATDFYDNPAPDPHGLSSDPIP